MSRTSPSDEHLPRRIRAAPQRHHNEGHGRRLTAAFEALEAFPALAESRNRLLRVVKQERVSTSDVVAAVETDVALVIAVLRLGNQVEGKTRGKVESVVAGRRAAVARGRPGARHPRPHLRLLRALVRLGRRARALPPARRRHPARRRPHRHRGRLRAPRPPDGHRAAARHRQARPDARLPRLPAAGPQRGPHAGGAHPPRAPRARRRPRAGRRRPRPPLGAAQGRRVGHRAPPLRRRDRRGRVRPPGGHARPLLPGRRRLADRAAEDRAHDRPRADRAAGDHVRPSVPDHGPHPPGRSRAR